MIKKIKKFLPNYWEVIVYFFALFFFIFNAHYVSYPDEFVNILGGKSILANKLPYRDFFDHHLPFAWYLASFFLIFSSGSYVRFRLFWSLFSFFMLFFLGIFIKKKYQSLFPYYLIFFAFYPLMAVYFWFHLYLADSLAVLFFSLSFWLILIQTISKKSYFNLQLIGSVLNFFLVFSSMTFIYLSLGLYLWQIYLIWPNKKKLFFYLLWSMAPYGLYLGYLWLTKTFTDFYFANFIYNTKLYISIPNYVKGNNFNPLKFAATLIDNFYQGYVVLLSKIKHLDLYLPIGNLTALGTLSLLIFFLSKDLVLGIAYFIILSFSAPRSSLNNFSETDYQTSLFLVLGLISAITVFYLIKTNKQKNDSLYFVKEIVQTLIFIFGLFSFIFLLQNSYHKLFLVKTQKMPAIYDLSYPANFIDEIIEKGDYFWIGPYEPNHQFFVKKGQLPGKYPTLLPQFRENDYLKNDFITQFKKSPPKIIIFKHEASIFMTPASEFGEFFLKWLNNSYTPIEKLKNITVLKSPSEFNLKTDLYLLNSEKNKLLNKLKEKGYLQ